MVHVLLRFVRHHRVRGLTLFLGALVASTVFSILVSTVESRQARIHQTVKTNFRSAYDILVRPKGTRTTLEKRDNLVRANYQSGIFGGISLEQYRTISKLPGVSVAAPVAMVGYVFQDIEVPIDLTRYLTASRREAFAIHVSRTTDDGLTRFPTDEAGFVYITRNALHVPFGKALSGGPSLLEQIGPTASTPVCRFDSHAVAERLIEECWSTQNGQLGLGWGASGLPAGHVGVAIDWSFPFLVAAIDPVAEAKLAGIKSAVVRGRYLSEDDRPLVSGSGFRKVLTVPVIASTHSYTADTDTVTVRPVPDATATAMLRNPSAKSFDALVAQTAERPVLTRKIEEKLATATLLRRLLSGPRIHVVDNYWTSLPVSYRQIGAKRLDPELVDVNSRVWRSPLTGVAAAPIDIATPSYRKLISHPASIGYGALNLPNLHAVGLFDPLKLPGFAPFSHVPMGTYNPPIVSAADASTARLLHDRVLEPNGNIAGYLQPPPLLLTTLSSLSAFQSSAFPAAERRAPISVIRVRVVGVHGPDALSRARIAAVAQAISTKTGLDVDVTAGSSPTPVTVQLHVGNRHHLLQLREGWVQKGAALYLLTTTNRKSVVLLALVALMAVSLVGVAGVASVRVQRLAIATLTALGWAPRRVAALLFGEIAGPTVAGAVTSVAVSLSLRSAGLVGVSLVDAALAIPAVLAVAILGGALPALRAAGLLPSAISRAGISLSRFRISIRSVTGLAIANSLRVRGRTVIALISVSLGAGCVLVFLGARLAYNGLISGTVLGNALLVQTDRVDLPIAAALLLLGLTVLTDTLVLNATERLAEFTALAAIGWAQRSIVAMLATEGFLIGGAAAVIGCIGGLVALTAVTASAPAGLVTVAFLILLFTTAVSTALGAVVGLVFTNRLHPAALNEE